MVVRTDLSGKESHRQGGVGKVVTLGNLGGIMVTTLAWNARGVGSIPAPSEILPIFNRSYYIHLRLSKSEYLISGYVASPTKQLSHSIKQVMSQMPY